MKITLAGKLFKPSYEKKQIKELKHIKVKPEIPHSKLSFTENARI
jgi:hypothetical protein